MGEDYLPKPRDPYGVSKVAAEALCYQWSLTGHFDIIMARPFNHTGRGQLRAFAIPGFAAQLVEMTKGLRDPVLVTGDVTVSRDFLDVRDVVRAYQLLLEKGRNGEVYNVCSGEERVLGDIVRDMARIVGVAPKIITQAARVRQGEQKRMAGNVEKLKRDTGWTPEVPWEDTLKIVIEDWKERLA